MAFENLVDKLQSFFKRDYISIGNRLANTDVFWIKSNDADPLFFALKNALEYQLDIDQLREHVEPGAGDPQRILNFEGINENIAELSDNDAAIKNLTDTMQHNFAREFPRYVRQEMIRLGGDPRLDQGVEAVRPRVDAFITQFEQDASRIRTSSGFKAWCELLRHNYISLRRDIEQFNPPDPNFEPPDGLARG